MDQNIVNVNAQIIVFLNAKVCVKNEKLTHDEYDKLLLTHECKKCDIIKVIFKRGVDDFNLLDIIINYIMTSSHINLNNDEKIELLCYCILYYNLFCFHNLETCAEIIDKYYSKKITNFEKFLMEPLNNIIRAKEIEDISYDYINVLTSISEFYSTFLY